MEVKKQRRLTLKERVINHTEKPSKNKSFNHIYML
jgi:hypothetical protein